MPNISLFQPFKRPSPRKAGVISGITAVVGVVIVIRIFAAGTPTGFEGEDGILAGCANSVTDSTASGGSAIRFASCANSDPLVLDASGATVPDTSYVIPSGAIYVATTGSDGNSGTSESSPVQTITKAISLALTSGTIVVRAGNYRDWYNNGSGNYATLSKTLTIQAYPHEQVWFDGADIEPSSKWTNDGSGHWTMAWSTPSFCNGGYYSYAYNAQNSDDSGPCSHYDQYGSTEANHPAAGDPQMVFSDGARMTEVDTLAGATGGAFYYDWANRRIYISNDPSAHTVELAARPMAFNISANNVTIRGLGFRRYATNEYDNTTKSAVYLGGTGGLAENDAFTQMAGQGLTVQPVGTVVNHSVFAFNGFNGMGGNGHAHSSGIPDGLIIENSRFSNNNIELYGLNCNASCAASGVKIAHMDGFVMKNNVAENGQAGADGLWCDEDCTNGVIVNNLIRGNGGKGISYEVSNTGIIASNLVLNTGNVGIAAGSANTKVINNTVINALNFGIWIYDDQRVGGSSGTGEVGPDSVNDISQNNVIYGSGSASYKISRSSGAQTGPPDFLAPGALDYNSYFRSTGPSKLLLQYVDNSTINYNSMSAFTTAYPIYEAHSHDISSGADPFFTDFAGGNYSIRSGSVAYHSATTLPDDVASVLGLSVKTGYSRGAISWPGQ